MAVILEEMLHMGLSSNLLNALGGTPLFTQAPYLPVFPGRLLRTVEKPVGWGPCVDLLPLSPDLLDLIIEIELPEWDTTDPIGTLGGFYDECVSALLPPEDSKYQGGRQLAPWDNPGAGQMFSVNCKATAEQAVAEIKDQGEGTKKGNHDDGDHELAHYWRFKEIQDDPSLDFATDVYPVVPSPGEHVANYSTEQRAANDTFNQTYSRMLDALEKALTGTDPDVYPVATGLMGQLEHQASLLRATGLIQGTQSLPGPTFEYVAEQ